ncbi:PREDICTED: uncharacterized protein LOC106123360 [Papilio xuthus]|uniref:Uncharacterized protein LOC106123360 n=1 Tax=Papilio xuthus TaxID=66420 RepID=A0A194Q8P8_PAPXU|nr:PREDICTED: uncharacterized protein LOC106123360 [Papilio xuthus]KPJ01903.1 hypothetical protein RR46_05112 [Papilio xuthus]
MQANSDIKLLYSNGVRQQIGGEKEKRLSNDLQDWIEINEALKCEVRKFVEITKYFSSPLKKSASYICENSLVSYPQQVTLESKRGVATTNDVKFCNLTLEPVLIKYYKIYPEIENLKFQNLSKSRCCRIPPGLSHTLYIVYNSVNEETPINTKIIFVATKKTTTPCYQICEIDLEIIAQKVKR